MKRLWMGVASVILLTGCQSEDRSRTNDAGTGSAVTPNTGVATPGAPSPAGAGQTAAQDGGQRASGQAADIFCPNFAVQGLQDEAGRLFQMADTNQDGQLSKQEAIGASNFIVGGFFFRADADADGTVTPEEARAARRELTAQMPRLGVLLQGIRGATGQSPFQGVAQMLDVDYGKPLNIREMREAVQKAVDAAFVVADGDRNANITLAEARGAVAESARTLGRLAFAASDTDKDGRLSQPEFEAAIVVPARAAFAMVDTNRSGTLSPEEAREAVLLLMNQLGAGSAMVQQVRAPGTPAPGPVGPGGKAQP